MGKVKNLKGKRFGKLVAIEFVGIGNRHYAMWRCDDMDSYEYAEECEDYETD